MRYIGASAWFIALPFIFEGVILGMISGIGAYFCMQIGYSLVLSKLATDLQMISLVSFSQVAPYVFLGGLGIGVFTGVMGSAISLGKYLKDFGLPEGYTLLGAEGRKYLWTVTNSEITVYSSDTDSCTSIQKQSGRLTTSQLSRTKRQPRRLN
jgi:hypothetical protein